MIFLFLHRIKLISINISGKALSYSTIQETALLKTQTKHTYLLYMDQFNPREFVRAIQTGNERKINHHAVHLSDQVTNFLMCYCNANRADAMDCSQEAFCKTVQTIRKDRLRNHDKAASYLRQAALNNYIKLLKKQKRMHFVAPSEKNYFTTTPPNQQYAMLEKEYFNQFILCLQTLSPKHRQCIRFWLIHPDAESRELAQHFDISMSNAYTRKSRARAELTAQMDQQESIKSIDPELKQKLYKRLPALYRAYRNSSGQ